MTLASPHHSEQSLLHRLRFTPLRDLARFQLSARLDFAGRIAAAGLGRDTASFIQKVMQRSRLSRLEQADVLDELIAHFADGEDQGRTAEELRTTFGDPAQAGRLIGRAQRRKRPWPYHCLRWSMRGVIALVALLILLYAVQFIRYMMIAPSPSVDYLARINAPAAAMAPQERAWPKYRDALLELTPPPLVNQGEELTPRGETWPEIAAWLDDNQAPIAQMREASTRPGLGIVLGFGVSEDDAELFPGERTFDAAANIPGSGTISDEPIFGVMVPQLSVLRTVGRILGDDALHHATLGNADLAAENLASIARLANQMLGSPFLIGELVGHAILARGCEAATLVLSSHPDLFTDEHFASIAHAYGAIDVSLSQTCLDGERSSFMDIVQRLYSDDGNGDGRLTREGIELLGQVGGGSFVDSIDGLTALTGPALCTIAASRRDVVDRYDRMLDEIRAQVARPLWERDFRTLDAEFAALHLNQVERMRYLPIAALTPHFGKAASAGDLSLMRRDALLLALVMQREFNRTGQWPANPDTLLNEMGLEHPVDQLDGQPLRTAMVDGQWRVYSIGANRVDDGGRRCSEITLGVPDHRAQMWRHPDARLDDPAGDWVLYPAPPPVRNYESEAWVELIPLYHFHWMQPVTEGDVPVIEG